MAVDNGVTTYPSLDALATDVDELRRLGVDDAYRIKQLHKIPAAMEVDRATVIREASRGKRVLHLGCGWPPSPLHQALVAVAAQVVGVDVQAPQITNCQIWYADLDTHPEMLPLREYDLIVAGEILEHLGNPGNLLCALCRLFPTTMVIVTVPNAFSEAARQWLQQGYEAINKEHVCWYSWHSLKVLVERSGYVICNWAWYNGPAYIAEGLVFIMKPEGA